VGAAAAVLGALLLISCAEGEPSAGEVRSPAVAGSFYPGDAAKLASSVSHYLAKARPAQGAPPIALIAPHAGYVYSGQVAADAYAQAAGHDYDLVVVLGTNHTSARFGGVSIWPHGGYRTPLGTVPIDEEVAAALIAADDAFTFEPSVHSREHSVEVQLPFIQHLFPQAKIVAAVVGRPDLDLCTRFGKALARAVAGRRALIVASADLSHYPAYDDAVVTDGRVLAAVASLDPERVRSTIRAEMRRGVPGLATCSCGEGPIIAALVAARELGASRGTLVRYANSGDVAVGDRSRVVGYGAMSITRDDSGPGDLPAAGDSRAEEQGIGSAGAGAAASPSFVPLAEDEKRVLLELARESIRGHLSSRKTSLPDDLPDRLRREQGVFVTLRSQGHLRGCIGHMADDTPVSQLVAAMALQAAFNDMRFPHVELDELPEIEIEISLLTPLRRIGSPAAIEVGRDGVLLRKEGRSAVFLPQVATEQGWDRDTMLTHLCRKAGLPPNAWQEKCDLFVFQAEVFSESESR
jgi:AmmeMemoRadiSam system protein B/AmmeMemoRadiSam system protein A